MNLLFINILTAFNTLLVPVQFQDRSLSCNLSQIQELGVQCKEYFEAQYKGEKDFCFTVSPIVTLSKPLAYYGANSVNLKDEHFNEAVKAACNELDASVDFKSIDNILFLVAGPGEDEGAGEDYIWPHTFSLSAQGSTIQLDGALIDRYSVCTELEVGVFTGPGKLCHETGHALGFPDLYDTDGRGSGGYAGNLPGDLSLMGSGFKSATLPHFCAIERELAGIGKCLTLTQGEFVLEENGNYLKLCSGNSQDEYLLVEYYQDRGIVIWSIDKRDVNAGYSTAQGREVTAKERWNYNELNCNPDHPCAIQISNFSFRGSDPSELCISRQEGNNITIARGIQVSELEVYQDGAAIKIICNQFLGTISTCKAVWQENGQDICDEDLLQMDQGTFCGLIWGKLKPSKSCSVQIVATNGQGQKYTLSKSFNTKYYLDGSIPFIVLRASDRNPDNSFIKGSCIPLKVFNLPYAKSTQWYFNGRALNGNWLTLTESGTLKAQIELSNSERETLVKEIVVK